MTMSIQKFQDPASCLTYVWTWIMSESSSEFLFLKFCLNFCLKFVWVSAFFVWILSDFLSEILSDFLFEFLCLNFVGVFNVPLVLSCFDWFRHVRGLSEFVWICLNVSECSLSFVWILVWNFVWIWSEFLSEFYLSFGGQRNKMSIRIVKRNNWGWKVDFERQISAIEASLQWQCRNNPWTRKEVWDFFKNRGCQKIEKPKKAGFGTSNPLFLRGSKLSLKKGTKKGIPLFYPDWQSSPWFLRMSV